MKKILWMLLPLVAIMTTTDPLWAQSNASEWDFIYVREDIVKPSLTKEYEAALSDLKSLLTEYKVTDFSNYAHLLDNFHFVHISPLNKLRDIEKGTMEFLAAKVKGKDFDLVWSDLTATTAASRNYILRYRPDLSYAPETIYWGEKTPYRRWNYLYFSPGFEKNIEKLLKAWKTLYEQKNISYGFRIFSGFVGVDRPLYIFTTWAKDPLDFQTNLAKAIEILGDEGAALWSETMTYVRVSETIEGWFLPQYSYVPEK